MIADSRSFLLTTATAVLMPAFASASVVTFDNVVSAGQTYTYANVIQPGETLEYRFTVLEDLLIANFSVSATATNGEADIRDIRFGIVEPLTGAFTNVESIDTVAAALAFVDGRTFSAGDMFSFSFSDGITNPVGVTLSLGAASIAAVPLPANGLLMLSIVLAGGIAGWRRRKAAYAAV